MSEIKSNADVEPCLSVVMPVYNEAATVAELIQIVLMQRPVRQLVVVDDAREPIGILHLHDCLRAS